MIVMEYYSLSKRLWYLYLDYTCKSTNAVQTTLLRKGFLMPSILFPLVNGYRLVKEIDSISSFSRSQVQKKTSVPSKIVAEPLPERRQSAGKTTISMMETFDKCARVELSGSNTLTPHTETTGIRSHPWNSSRDMKQEDQDTTSTDKSHAPGVSF